MKTKILYVCETCGISYADKDECKRCERSHTNYMAIVDAKYGGVNTGNATYPHKVLIEFADGKKRWYKE